MNALADSGFEVIIGRPCLNRSCLCSHQDAMFCLRYFRLCSLPDCYALPTLSTVALMILPWPQVHLQPSSLQLPTH
jgi:hypothetical protein